MEIGKTLTKSNKEFLFKTFKVLLMILPFIDCLNGVIQLGLSMSFSLGIVYRLAFLFVCFLICVDMKLDKFNVAAMVLVLFLFGSIFLHPDADFREEVGNFFTICLFPAAFVSIRIIKTENPSFIGEIESLFDFYCIIYPLTLLVPYVFGFGLDAYEDDAGFKGFYIATNAIASTIVLTSVLSLYKMFRDMLLKQMVVCLMNVVCIVLLGTKSGYLILLVSFVCFALRALRKGSKKRNEAIALILFLGVCAVVGAIVLHEQIARILERWQYFYERRDFISFMTSARSERIVPAFSYIFKKTSRLPYLFFGFGAIKASVLENALMEMDFIDLLLKYGILGFLAYVAFLAEINSEYKKYGKKGGVFRYLFFLILVIAFLVGHVVTNALMATNLALVSAIMCYREGEQ